VAYFDTHCHLNHESFIPDFAEVLARAEQSGIEMILVPGWDIESSQRAVNLAENYPQIVAAVGIHPTEWEKSNSDGLKQIENLALHPRVVAIGEVGLDFHHDPEHREEQSELFLKMVSIARHVNKPLSIHSRESIDDLLGLLIKTQASYQGVIHAYEGNLTQAKRFIDLGFMLGVGGPLTYKNAPLKKEVFSQVPLSSILLETDSPYLPPVPYRGQRNEPSYLPLVGEYLSSLRNQNKQQLLDEIYQNSYKMFLQDIVH
jgi:TatD DNase family protein